MRPWGATQPPCEPAQPIDAAHVRSVRAATDEARSAAPARSNHKLPTTRDTIHVSAARSNEANKKSTVGPARRPARHLLDVGQELAVQRDHHPALARGAAALAEGGVHVDGGHDAVAELLIHHRLDGDAVVQHLRRLGPQRTLSNPLCTVFWDYVFEVELGPTAQNKAPELQLALYSLEVQPGITAWDCHSRLLVGVSVGALAS